MSFPTAISLPEPDADTDQDAAAAAAPAAGCIDDGAIDHLMCKAERHQTELSSLHDWVSVHDA